MTRRQRRIRRRRRKIGGIMLILAGVIALSVVIRHGPAMQAQWLGQTEPTPTSVAYDRSVTTREIILPEQTWYTIQTGVFSSQNAAISKAEAYSDRGAPGTVVEDGGKWRVFIASYERETDAAAVRQRLGEQQRVETYLYAWTCPQLHLRLSGMAGQLDAAGAGLTLFTDAAEILRDTAALLDAAQLSTTDAQRAADDLNGQIMLWKETVHSRFGNQRPELVTHLMSMADMWIQQYETIRQAGESATKLSAALKNSGMRLFDGMIRLRRAMSG